MTAYVLAIKPCTPSAPIRFIDEDGAPCDFINQAEFFASATEAALAAIGLPYTVEWRLVGHKLAGGRTA